MVHLLTVSGAFQGKVVAARLGSVGIVTSLRGGVDGPYPMGDVEVLVDADDAELARQLLLADQVEAVYEGRPGRGRRKVALSVPLVATLAMVLAAVVSSLIRALVF